ncbi:MAG TPA: hypothetical protein VFJ57_07370 [Solirubrobacterales bacterium]|nr:hypothetical protein [Solirubrobacterales bacterium]
MIGRKSIIGVSVLCALALSVLGVTSASAAQRAYTCTKNVTDLAKQFKDAHCETQGTPPQTYGHLLITTANTATHISNAKTASSTTAAAVSKLKGALSGVETEVQCTGLTGGGALTNAAESVSGTATLEYSGCTVTKPAGKGCVVKGGAITTESLAATTVGQAAGNLKITPAGETNFAVIPIEKCSIEALNNNFPVTGSVVVTVTGATLSTTHSGVTTQNTLKFGGVKAGLEGSATLGMGTPLEDGEAIVLT